MAVKRMYWREAATLMLLAPISEHSKRSHQASREQREDYGVLVLRRSSKSSFQPNAVVFPGGAIDDHDFDENWKPLFERITEKPFCEVVQSLEISGPRLPLFSLSRPSSLCAEIAFRITAIRETFEESGVLLVRSADEFKRTDLSAVDRGKATTFHRIANVRQWRQRIRQDAAQFLVMCQELRLVPNIWGLLEWCNWLTPPLKTVTEPPVKPKRFDTMFFLCCLREMPRASADKEETTRSQWISPRSTVSHAYVKGGQELHPPQLYELSRLCRVPAIAEVCNFAHRREREGLQRTFPVPVLCSDGLILLYPGDSMYPEESELDLDGKYPVKTSTMTVMDCRTNSQRLNRVENMISNESKRGRRLLCNVGSNNHLTPLNSHEVAAPLSQI